MNIRFRWAFATVFVGVVLSSVGVRAVESQKPKVVYPKYTKFDLEESKIEGELKNPGEFYFQHKPEEKMDSLVQRRKNFHREMLRDVVLSK